jgi:RNA polymerase sigma-70 factor (ECF subfamily)
VRGGLGKITLGPASAKGSAPASALETPASVTDQELLRRLSGGDESAFEEVFRGYYAALVGAAERLVRERAVAEEVVQDVMLELWRRHDSLAVQESLRAYLHRATRNRALNHLRHERVVAAGATLLRGDGGGAPTGPQLLVAGEIDAALRAAVSRLPERCREVFELSRTGGLRYSEIAEVLGISVKTVEAQMGKALRILREGLAPWLTEP